MQGNNKGFLMVIFDNSKECAQIGDRFDSVTARRQSSCSKREEMKPFQMHLVLLFCLAR
jgi:hypothetical protein